MKGNDGGDESEETEASHTWSFTVADLHPVASQRRRPLTMPLPSSTPDEAVVTGVGTEEIFFPSKEESSTDTVPDIAKAIALAESEPEENGLAREPHTSSPSLGPRAMGAVGQTVVGRYKIEESIAVGGMGRVYRVKHLHLDKHFALKQMHSNFSADEKMRAGFLREARLASGLSHANIVSVVDFGEDPELGAFMVMELAGGAPLTRRLSEKGPLPLRMACEVILQIADALHYIHKEGIVHGDIKPDNILLRRAGRSELRRWKVCLLDFGLARPQVSADNDKDQVEGTPAYMAPEVICGEALAEPADIYSLGILAYQLVTGKTPFRGSMRELMIQHMSEPPSSLAARLGTEVDERLEALVMKALQKKPEDRQSSMAAFLFEMKTLMDMLGFGTRRTKKGSSRKSLEKDSPETRLGKMAFEQCEFGIAVIEKNGKVTTANSAFAHFFRMGPEDSPTDITVMDPRFIRIHPQLPGDLETMAHTKLAIRRLLTFNDGQGNSIELIFSLAPLVGAEDKLILSIVPIG